MLLLLWMTLYSGEGRLKFLLRGLTALVSVPQIELAEAVEGDLIDNSISLTINLGLEEDIGGVHPVGMLISDDG
eukprot:m.71251 g.71251  ORF g.71251 m.71251 type:complete len:74 (+) comp35738_c0_seq7:610-831(+)